MSADDQKDRCSRLDRYVDSARRNREAVLISQIRDRLMRTYSAPSPPWPIWASSNPTTSERNSGRPSHCGTWRRNTPRSDSAPILPLPVMTSTKVRPSPWARCKKSEQRAVGARLRHAMQVEPGIDLLPPTRKLRALATSERRQRRRARWQLRLRRARDLGGRKRSWRRDRFCGIRFRIRRDRLRLGGARFLAQRFDLFCDTLPQRVLFLAERTLAPRWRRQFGKRGGWLALHRCGDTGNDNSGDDAAHARARFDVRPRFRQRHGSRHRSLSLARRRSQAAPWQASTFLAGSVAPAAFFGINLRKQFCDFLRRPRIRQWHLAAAGRPDRGSSAPG